MKIVFVCGCIEEGKDGVGDYTRRLAAAFMAMGHKASIVSINEPQLPVNISCLQESDGQSVPGFRFVLKNSKAAVKIIAEIDPEWISFQYVPFSFQKKGLPFFLSKKLKQLLLGKQLHIMFHELWVGMNTASSKKLALFGWIQKKIILSMIARLKPALIHTQTHLYQLQLEAAGIKAEYLPLFSNIPVFKGKFKPVHSSNPPEIAIVHFGSIHPGSQVYQFAREAGQHANNAHVRIRLLILGFCGIESEKWKQIFTTENISVQILGRQTPEIISDILKNATFGITTNPVMLVEKSGSAAAMKAHNLCVVSIAQPWSPRGLNYFTNTDEVIQYAPGNFHKYIAGGKQASITYTENDIASRLVGQLSLSKKIPESKFLSFRF